MLSSLDFKIGFFEALNIDKVLVIPFTQEFSRLTPEEFVREVLYKKISAKNIVCGFNYTFGHKGAGTVEDLINLANKFEQKVRIMEPLYIKNQLVSSTRIRKLISLGQIEEARELLGYNPRIKGKVIQGNKIGRKIGFPTVNLSWDKQLMIPGTGVYAVEIKVGSVIKKGVANIGYKPTISTERNLTIEAHIFDFAQDIYNSEIELIFYHKIRNEIAFNSLEELKNQIRNDNKIANNYFSK
jgi:riboflavin kinase/FMN adenylyltransferase